MTALGSGTDEMRSRHHLYVLLLLTAAYTVSQIDRSMINILMEPIKLDLGLSDTQLGLLTGLAFALFYSILGVPVAYLADRTNRVLIAALGVALWAVMMLCTGFVSGFTLLLLVRVGAGAGEAGVFPAGYSLIGDHFTAQRRVRAFSVFMTGVGLSIALGFILAGWANQAFGWRKAFIIAAVPGALLAILAALTLREPRRRRGASTPLLPRLSLTRVLVILGRNASFRNIVLAVMLANVGAMGVSQWAGVFYTRAHHLSSEQLGLWLGVVAGGSAALGTLVGGFAADRWFRGNSGNQLRLAAGLTATQVPFVLLILYVPNAVASLLLLIPLYVGFFAYNGPVLAITQDLVDARMRAVAVAVTAMVLNLMGTGLGPLVVGALSDLFTPYLGIGGLKLAMLITALSALASGWMFVRASRTVTGDLEHPQGAEPRTLTEAAEPTA
ncbi:spinster family MFS transporter [Streptomyces sp. NPDC004296]|uniref:spinster family MFS transporter n=1 Tax=Streptomyces sp. NPDC004296 TaxID=3364697 RepID=UPI00368420F7